jgi:hypothetical protein
MNASRLFRLANRANSLLLLALLAFGAVALAAAGVSEVWSQLGRRGAQDGSPGEDGEGRAALEPPVAIEGTPITVVALTVAQQRKGFSSGGSWSQTRNLLFHDLTTGATRWLRPKSDAAILGWEVVREGTLAEPYDDEGSGRGARGKAAPLAIRYEIAETDTDGDGVVGGGDRLVVALSSPSGDGLATVVRDVDEVRGYSAPFGGKLSVFFRRGERELAAELDLAARRPIRESQITIP